jgi:hypothetical protein
MRLMGILFALLFSTQAMAGFRAFNGTTDLKLFDGIKCSTGLTCSREFGNLLMTSSPTLASALTLTGAEATAAILNMKSDESDDSGDDWVLSALTSNSFSFANDVSGSSLTKMTLSTGGVLNLFGSEAGDGGLIISSDESDDSGDDWTIGVAASGNALSLSNDTSGSVVAKMTLSTAGAMTSVVSITGAGTGAISGYLRAQVASTTTGITAAQCGSTFVSNSADVMTLPEASTVLGCRLAFVCGTADDFDVNPADGTDVIGITGALAPSAGDAIRCTDIGAGFELEAVGANLWAVIGTNGTITDVD